MDMESGIEREREIGRDMGREIAGRDSEVDTHMDAGGTSDVKDGDAEGISRPAASTTTTSSSNDRDTNTNTSRSRKPMLIPIPTEKGVELQQLPDYIPPRKDVWQELREDQAAPLSNPEAAGGAGKAAGEGSDGDEYAPLSIVTPYTPSYASHPTQSHPSNSTQSHIHTYSTYTPYTPSSASYPSFTLNLGVEESPLGALTPLTPLTPMTPRTPGGRWFDPIQNPVHRETEGHGQEDSAHSNTFASDTESTKTHANRNKNKGKQRAGEYLDGDCGICFEEAVAPTLTPCCRAVFCAEHLDEWLRGPESDGRCPACKRRVGLDFDVDLDFAVDSSRGNMQNDMQNNIPGDHAYEHAYGNGDGGEGVRGRGRGVETTSAWRWLASWLVPERTDDDASTSTSTATSTALSTSSPRPTHHPDSTHRTDTAESASPSASRGLAGVPAPAIPSNTSTSISTSMGTSTSMSRGRYGSPYTPYPYSPLAGIGSETGIGTPITPGTPPATQGFIPMAPSGVSGAYGGKVHPLAAHVERVYGEGIEGERGGDKEDEREKKREGESERVKEGEMGGETEGQKDGEKEESSSSSSSASLRTNSSPEIAGEGSTSSACTTPPVPSLALPALPCPPAILLDGVGVGVGGGGDEEADATTTTGMMKSRPGAGEDVDVVGTLSRFLSLVGLLGLFYVLLS